MAKRMQMNGLVCIMGGIKKFLLRSNWLSCCYGLKIYTIYMYSSYPRSGFAIPLAFSRRVSSLPFARFRESDVVAYPSSIPHFEPSRSKPPLSILLRKLQRF